MVGGCNKPEKVQALGTQTQESGKKITPQERPYYEAGKPFAEAIATHDYAKAYGFLSSHARSRMSLNQFAAPDDDAAAARNDAAAVSNPTSEKFAQMLATTEKEYGKPTGVLDVHVFSTDPLALSGKGTSIENKLDSMFAIGMMPASIPSDIRKASLRSKLQVELSPQQLAEAAKAQQTTPEKLKSDPDYKPYLNLKKEDGLRWTCTHTNGIQGDPVHPPKTCQPNCNACGWNATNQRCELTPTEQLGPSAQTRIYNVGDPMPLTFGELADDDMCNMFGYYVRQEDVPKLP